MDVIFTRHASEKFAVLERHDFPVARDVVLETVRQPELVDRSRLPLLIAQKSIDPEHVLRVVYKHEAGNKLIITFYPGRKSQYGGKDQ